MLRIVKDKRKLKLSSIWNIDKMDSVCYVGVSFRTKKNANKHKFSGIAS